ncbi:hypothetical protein [Nocardia salmonicida]|uniref:hypothetical protein n=1 Tax=Nocardia salmonicida TaxID=53431 RepID=UPI003CEA1928
MPTRAEVNQWNPTLLADAGQRIQNQNQDFKSLSGKGFRFQQAGEHLQSRAHGVTQHGEL